MCECRWIIAAICLYLIWLHFEGFNPMSVTVNPEVDTNDYVRRRMKQRA